MEGLRRALERGRVFFFAGSGISYDSRLSSADMVARATARRMLPGAGEAEISLCARVQPELFYETLIDLTGDRRCLDVWRVLHPDAQARWGARALPNDAHRVIVSYSADAGVPVFTTNFDTMFEDAARELGIPFDLLLPDDDPPPSSGSRGGGRLAICKLHGSVAAADGSLDLESLWTTVTEISTVNTRWLPHLLNLMDQRDLCLVGYSGRDIDLFPHIRERALARRALRRDGDGDRGGLYWIAGAFSSDDPATINALSSSAVLVEGRWPRGLFADLGLIDPAWAAARSADGVAGGGGETGDGEGMTLLLDELASGAAARPLTRVERGMLLAILAGHAESHHAMERHLAGIPFGELAGLSGGELARFHILYGRLDHEMARYRSLARRGWAALRFAAGDPDIVVQALAMICEASRMRVPADAYFPAPSALRPIIPFMGLAVGVRFVAAALPMGIIVLFHWRRLKPATRHVAIEHAIRALALFQRVAGNGRGPLRGAIAAGLCRVWDAIARLSHRVGYAAGMANAGKFRGRLRDGEGADDARRIYGMFAHSTGLELLERNAADAARGAGRWDAALSGYERYRAMAARNGNRLNEVKGWLGVFATRFDRDGAISATAAERSAFEHARRGVEGWMWEWYLNDVSRRLVPLSTE